MSGSQQDVARRELAELDVAMGRSVLREGDAPLAQPGWLPAMHTDAQWREHQRRLRLWEAQEAGRLQESTATLERGGRVALAESTAVKPMAVSGRRIRVTIATPGMGASGFYGADVLEAAAGDRVFPTSTVMMIDHATARERQERPEGSVRDIAAVFTTDARWNGSALVAEAELMAAHADLLAPMAGVIGVSLRATGDVEMGEVDGQRVRKITRLIPPAQSVDFVTRAGRGGRFEVLESRGFGWGA